MDDKLLSPEVAQLVERLKTEYAVVRVLDDGTIIAIQRLMYTVGLFVDLDAIGWGSRYCYEDPGMALAALVTMKTGDDEPLPGYIAKRGG